MSVLTITIPGKLNRLLSPNHGQRNPRAKAAVRREAKDMAYLYGKQAAYTCDLTGIEHATYSIVLGKAKGEKSKDIDNLIASCKATLDGIALALGVDDRYWQVHTVAQVRDPEGIGYVAITLEWQSDANEQVA